MDKLIEYLLMMALVLVILLATMAFFLQNIPIFGLTMVIVPLIYLVRVSFENFHIE